MKRLWLKGTKGLNNVVDPARAEYDPEKGLQWLAESYNVDYDNTGRISRRRGWAVTDVTTSCHSLACFRTVCLFVSGGNLCWLGTDYSKRILRSVTADARMSYVEVGDKIYFMNGVERGFVKAGVANTWNIPSVIRGPETTRQYQAPPIGQIVGYYKGRIYVIAGDVLYYSEAYGHNMVDYARNSILLGSVGKMFHPVEQGIYLGTAKGVWFLRGNTPTEFVWETVSLTPAVRGSNAEVFCQSIGGGNFSGIGVIWTGTDGIYLGLPDGKAMNLTEGNIKYEIGTKAASIILDDRYVCSMPDTSRGRLTLVLNLRILSVGQYINYPFNSFGKFWDKYLGANASGVFVLDEADLDGTAKIQSRVKLPITDFGHKGSKRIRFIELSYETDAGLKLIPIADNYQGHLVEVVPKSRSNVQEVQSVAVGRYLRGRNWELAIENLDGADFSIDEVSAVLTGLRPY